MDRPSLTRLGLGSSDVLPAGLARQNTAADPETSAESHKSTPLCCRAEVTFTTSMHAQHVNDALCCLEGGVVDSGCQASSWSFLLTLK